MSKGIYNFIKKFSKIILNIHPSLLPKYKGLNTHFKAIKNKDKYSGATVHIVDEKLDSGQIILQKKVKILKSDTEKLFPFPFSVFPPNDLYFFNPPSRTNTFSCPNILNNHQALADDKNGELSYTTIVSLFLNPSCCICFSNCLGVGSI